jgi:hypothetical protein
MVTSYVKNGRKHWDGSAGEIIRSLACDGYDVVTNSKTDRNKSWFAYDQNGNLYASILSSFIRGTWTTFAFSVRS